ncbi:MAG: DUF6879 family protein [Micromonosporaceae bacterium]
MTTVPTFSELLSNCERSAVHLEMRDGYMRSDPSFIAWQNGEHDDPADKDPQRRPWLGLVRETVDRGVEVRRARIVSEPISDYIRFEHHVTAGNVAAGEQVRWLPRRRATDLAVPGNDFWLFDDQLVLINHFDGEGEVTEHELITDSPALAKLCASAFEAVWERAIPHEQYRPT